MLEKKSHIASYVVTFPIKKGTYAETYRVKDSSGKNYFLKLIDCASLHHSQFDEESSIIGIKISKQLNQDNLIKYHDSGEVQLNGRRWYYLVFDFIVGETLSQKLSRQHSLPSFEVKEIALGVLQGLQFLHSQNDPIIHNEVTAQNVMIDISSTRPIAKLIDFGHARFMSQPIGSVNLDDVNPFYLAPEALNGVFTPQSDIYSVGALLYYLLFGMMPFFTDLSSVKKDPSKLKETLIEAKKAKLKIPDMGKNESDMHILAVINKALQFDVDNRFGSVTDFIDALNGNEDLLNLPQGSNENTDAVDSNSSDAVSIKKGNGFADVAGMTPLKEQLQSDVIDVIKNPDKAKEFGIFIPNGILFYGPPGCGKTFFAEKFAEEAGFNYKYIKCSDIACPYIHGGQSKIADIFKEARDKAPTILFFDEIDAMVKDRSLQNTASEAGEVNEFLAQLNNCGENGVLVIGATNKPDQIDPAALRAGRLEFKYFIPLPDSETRASIFRINLEKRRCDFGIDYDALSNLTENYISADIKMIVDNAARLTFRRKERKILQSTIEEVIAQSQPSLSSEIINHYEELHNQMTGKTSAPKRKKIGFI